MKRSVASIGVFAFGLLLFLVIALTGPLESLVGDTLLFLWYVSVPAGLALAFWGAREAESPKYLSMIGFSLNAAWFLLALVLVMQTAAVEPRVNSWLLPDPQRDLWLEYGQYMAENRGERGDAFCSLAGCLGTSALGVPITREQMITFLGEPDYASDPGGDESYVYFYGPQTGSQARTNAVHVAVRDGKVTGVSYSYDISPGQFSAFRKVGPRDDGQRNTMGGEPKQGTGARSDL